MQVVDRLMWLGFEREVNIFRKNVLGLEPLRIGQSGHDILNVLKVGQWVHHHITCLNQPSLNR